MIRYVCKRLLLTLPILLGVTFIVFTIINITPGDPGRRILGVTATQEAVDQLNHELGYDKPFFPRFVDYVKNIVLHFDFGISYQSKQPALDNILANFKYTFRLTLLCTCFYMLIGLPLGVASAVKQYSAFDNVSRVICICMGAFPSFWIAMISVLVFSLWLGWLPPSGVDGWQNYILPVGVMGLLHASSLQRLTRTIMLESIRQDYVRTARAKGASERTVIWKHAFANALLPIINSIGVTFGAMLGGAVLIESVFSMPGLGQVGIKAITSKDIPLVMANTLFLSAIFCLIVLFIDVISAFADPRVRAKYTK